ncbi:MAG: Clp protease ClpP [Lachnospiraceae bacterium]|nr:Clp protease ClpP [Lachnospiraceae bacterium]
MPAISKKPFYEFKNQTDEKVDLYFYGDIVSRKFMAWEDEDQYPDSIKNILDGAAGRDINVFINSGGGNVFAGIAIYNLLKRYSGKVTVTVEALAASIASVIAFAGNVPPKVPRNAFLMIHKPWLLFNGNADEMREAADILDRIETAILTVYEDNLAEGVSIEEIKTLMDSETWLNGDEAARYFNVTVTEESKIAAHVGDYENNFKNNIPKTLLNVSETDTTEEKDTVLKQEIINMAMQRMGQ